VTDPMKRPLPSDPVDERLFDRLVDGELADAERRELLLSLEQQPDGWRRCALAFLEAQSWREAVSPFTGAAFGGPATPTPVLPQRKLHPSRLAARWIGLAAGVALAFVLGWWIGEGPHEYAHRPVTTAPEITTPRIGDEPALAQAREPDNVEGSRPSGSESAALLNPLLKQWQQWGYHTELQKRLVSMELADGRKVNVPVQEIRLRHPTDRTY
jgi:hypothetical protein